MQIGTIIPHKLCIVLISSGQCHGTNRFQFTHRFRLSHKNDPMKMLMSMVIWNRVAWGASSPKISKIIIIISSGEEYSSIWNRKWFIGQREWIPRWQIATPINMISAYDRFIRTFVRLKEKQFVQFNWIRESHCLWKKVGRMLHTNITDFLPFEYGVCMFFYLVFESSTFPQSYKNGIIEHSQKSRTRTNKMKKKKEKKRVMRLNVYKNETPAWLYKTLCARNHYLYAENQTKRDRIRGTH